MVELRSRRRRLGREGQGGENLDRSRNRGGGAQCHAAGQGRREGVNKAGRTGGHRLAAVVVPRYLSGLVCVLPWMGLRRLLGHALHALMTRHRGMGRRSLCSLRLGDLLGRSDTKHPTRSQPKLEETDPEEQDRGDGGTVSGHSLIKYVGPHRRRKAAVMV
jgi:hypothetical protein